MVVADLVGKMAMSRVLLMATAVVLGGTLLAWAHSEVEQERQFFAGMDQIKVLPPPTSPEISQESIDLALIIYGIRVPNDVNHPILDRDLADRGVTVRYSFVGQAKVAVGPSAFASWSLLGSTLAHEIEVHGHQNFFGIWIMDSLGLDGTMEAERQAYAHELRYAERFGLKIHDAAMIAETVEFFYPEVQQDDYNQEYLSHTIRHNAQRHMIQASHYVKKWLAKNFVGVDGKNK